MSITVETLATKRVIDTRTDVNSYARRTYQIFDGPQDTGFVKFPPNGGNGTPSNQLNFTLNPPSTRVFVNRRVVIEATFEVVLTGVPNDGGYLLNYNGTGATAIGTDPAIPTNNGTPARGPSIVSLGATQGTNGPRAYPLANATRSLQVSLNNDQLSQNLGQYWRATTRYANSLGQSEIAQGSTATMLDMAQAYEFTRGNPLSPFAERGVNPLQTSRTSLVGIQVLNNPQYFNDYTSVTARVRFTVREPLYLSPFLFQSGDQDTGLIGVQTMNLQLQLGGRGGNDLAAAVYSVDDTGTFGEGIGPVVQTVTAQTIEAFVYMNYLTPDALQIIPDINNYPYYEPTLYTTTNNTPIAAGSGPLYEVVMNNIQLNSIPQRLLIFIDEPDSQATVYKSDTFCAIDQVNISFDNRDSLLAAAQPIDLYNIAAKNNTNLTWTEFSRDVGSVLCLNFGEDIPLRANQAVGLRGSYNLRMQVRFRNVKTARYDNFGDVAQPLPLGVTLNVVVFGVGVMTIAQQNVVRTVGILTNEDVLRSKTQPALPYHNSGDLYGGGWFDDFRNAFMSVARPLAGIASKVLPMLAPETAPFMGAFNSIINPEPQAGPGNTGLVRSFGNGLVGGNVSGGRLVGGKKVTRAQLAKMLR